MQYNLWLKKADRKISYHLASDLGLTEEELKHRVARLKETETVLLKRGLSNEEIEYYRTFYENEDVRFHVEPVEPQYVSQAAVKIALHFAAKRHHDASVDHEDLQFMASVIADEADPVSIIDEAAYLMKEVDR